LALKTRKRGTEAEPIARPKRQVAVVAARNIESIGLGEPRRIAISGAKNGRHDGPFGNRLAPDTDVRSSHPDYALDRAIVAKHFPHCAGKKPRVVAQQTKLIRMEKQGQDAVTD